VTELTEKLFMQFLSEAAAVAAAHMAAAVELAEWLIWIQIY
jgi:hypothetical protein